jgi:glyoxylase-like metal-dependent hydrolase (beta-lactamase superfamily II)
MTRFRQLIDAPTGACTYLLSDPDTAEAVAIDITRDHVTLPLLALLDELDLRLTHLLYTHLHDEEIAVAHVLGKRTGATLVAAPDAADVVDRGVRHGDAITFGSEVIRVIGTPGHTQCDLSFLWHDRLFTGHSLLIRGCGCSRHACSDPGRLYDSIVQRLLVLPGETLVFPGEDRHGRTVSTIAEERSYNRCFATMSRDEFVTHALSRSR